MSDRLRRPLPPLPLPGAGWPLIALLAIFLISGTVGHDPWKIEDATHFGVIWRVLGSGEWLGFRLINGSEIEPPLFYWIGALFGGLLSPWLDWPDAVRLASPALAAVCCAMLFLAARELNGPDAAGGAPLALVGSLGFLVQSHETQPMMAALAGLSAVYAGLALAPTNSRRASLLIGGGVAGVLLGHGLTLTPALLLTAAVAIGLSPAPRTGIRTAAGGLAIGLALSAPWFILLAAVSPSELSGWWAGESRQFAAVASVGANTARWGELLAWFTWPALPLALWALWANRKELADRRFGLPLAACVAMLVNLTLVFEARVVAALAILPALALLAVPGTLALRRGAASGFDWFGRMTFGLIAGLVWLGWMAMNFGVPAKIARNFAKLAPGFEAPMNLVATVIAAAATILWLWLIIVRESPRLRPPLRPLAHWVGGTTLIWVLITSLWLPWIEYGKTYRGVAAEIASRTGNDCIVTLNVGEAQFASLGYFLDRRLRPGRAAERQCQWQVMQSTPGEAPLLDGWEQVWEGARPGDRSERFRLYRRS